MTHTIDERLGNPAEDVTHWGLMRVTGYTRPTNGGARRANLERLDYPDAEGVRIDEWPLDTLSIDVVRERWGAGTFRCVFLVLDPENEEPSKRRRSAGNGPFFTLAELAEEDAPPPAPPPPAVPVPSGAGVSDMLQFARAIFEMSQVMAQRPAAPVAAPDTATAELRAELARMQARLDAEAAQREAEERHRAELAERDRRIAELERERERAELEADRDEPRPMFEAGTPLTEQIGPILANAVATIALKNPELAMQMAEKALDRFKPAPPSAPPPPPAPAPAAPPPMAPRAHVRVVQAPPPAAAQKPPGERIPPVSSDPGVTAG